MVVVASVGSRKVGSLIDMDIKLSAWRRVRLINRFGVMVDTAYRYIYKKCCCIYGWSRQDQNVMASL